MLKRNFSKSPDSFDSNEESFWRKKRWIIVIIVAFFLFLLSGFAYYKFKKPELPKPTVEAYFSKGVAWLTEHENSTNGNANYSKAKMTMEAMDFEPKVHFEFYSDLPSSDAEPIEPDTDMAFAKNEEHPLAVENRITAANPLLTNLDLNGKKPTIKKPIIAKLNKTKPVIKAEDLEKEFSAQLKPKQYFLQFKSFAKADEAERFRKTLAAFGKMNVVKVSLGNKIIYRIQSRPSLDSASLKNLQKKLRAKGIASSMQTANSKVS